jgi:hypothetical protein
VFGDENYIYRHQLRRRRMEMVGLEEYWYDTHAALEVLLASEQRSKFAAERVY